MSSVARLSQPRTSTFFGRCASFPSDFSDTGINSDFQISRSFQNEKLESSKDRNSDDDYLDGLLEEDWCETFDRGRSERWVLESMPWSNAIDKGEGFGRTIMRLWKLLRGRLGCNVSSYPNVVPAVCVVHLAIDISGIAETLIERLPSVTKIPMQTQSNGRVNKRVGRHTITNGSCKGKPHSPWLLIVHGMRQDMVQGSCIGRI